MSSSRSVDSCETPAQLLANLHGSYQLLGQLLDSHRNYLLKIIGEEIDPRLIRRHGVSDIVQTALLRVLENFQRATEGIFAVSTEEDLRKWLRQTCLNALKQEYRDESRELRDFRNEEPSPEGLERPGRGPSPSTIVRDQERDALLLGAINTLSEADRMLLRLKDFHDWTYTALAELVERGGDGRGTGADAEATDTNSF